MSAYPSKSGAILRRIALAICILLSVVSESAAQDTVRVMFYNVLNFPSGGAVNRQDTMERIFQYAQPDILLVCELESASGANDILSALQNSVAPDFQRATYVENQSSSNNLQNMLYYRSSKLSLTGQDEVLTDLRDINEYSLTFIEDGASIPMDLYASHLKASDGSTNEARRKLAIDNLKAHLASINENRYRVFAGDFNMYRSSEDGYQELINGSSWNFDDPINTPGNWHNNSAYASIHSQSTRSTSFGSGVSGGMDDRFDFIMLSEEVTADTGAVRYLSGSYETIGQDGNHFNQSINDGFNGSAPASVISALYQSSDHCPIMLDLLIDAPTVVDTGGTGTDPTGCNELFFFAYLEGSSNNKAFGIYNPGDAAVDMAGYAVSNYNNGSAIPNGTENLSGTIPAGGTYTLVNSSAEAGLLALADITSTTTLINGDDAVALSKDGIIIDQIGEIGVDPGTSWPVGSGSTQNHTLIRMPDITEGTTNWTIGATQWIVLPEDYFPALTAHTFTGACAVDSCSTTTAPTGLYSTIEATGIALSWDDLPGAQKCEIQGRPLGAPSFSKIRVNVPPFEAFVDQSKLSPGSTYEWAVRCACNLSPLEVTPLGDLTTFTWPTPRLEQSTELGLFPNPVHRQIQIDLPPESSQLSILSITGKIMWRGDYCDRSNLAEIQEQVSLDVTDWPEGLYTVIWQSGAESHLGKFTVLH